MDNRVIEFQLNECSSILKNMSAFAEFSHGYLNIVIVTKNIFDFITISIRFLYLSQRQFPSILKSNVKVSPLFNIIFSL